MLRGSMEASQVCNLYLVYSCITTSDVVETFKSETETCPSDTESETETYLAETETKPSKTCRIRDRDLVQNMTE